MAFGCGHQVIHHTFLQACYPGGVCMAFVALCTDKLRIVADMSRLRPGPRNLPNLSANHQHSDSVVLKCREKMYMSKATRVLYV